MTETPCGFLATHQWVGERESEGHNTGQFPGDGHEKVVCRSRLCALTCGARVRIGPWHRSDDVALLGPTRSSRIEFARRIPTYVRTNDLGERQVGGPGRGINRALVLIT